MYSTRVLIGTTPQMGGTENPLGVQHYPNSTPQNGGYWGYYFSRWGVLSEILKNEEYPREWGVLMHVLGVVLKMGYSIKHTNGVNYSEKL